MNFFKRTKNAPLDAKTFEELVERVAKTLYDAGRRDKTKWPVMLEWDELPKGFRELFMDEARGDLHDSVPELEIKDRV